MYVFRMKIIFRLALIFYGLNSMSAAAAELREPVYSGFEQYSLNINEIQIAGSLEIFTTKAQLFGVRDIPIKVITTLIGNGLKGNESRPEFDRKSTGSDTNSTK